MRIEIQKLMNVKHEDKTIFYGIGDNVVINDKYTGTICSLQDKRLILGTQFDKSTGFTAKHFINYKDIKSINGRVVKGER